MFEPILKTKRTHMKKFILSIILLAPLMIFAQCGVYLTKEDYLQKKLSKVCERIKMSQVGGKFVIKLVTGSNEEKIVLAESGIWGFRRKNTDYRIIETLPRAIATAGSIYVYSGYWDTIGTRNNQVMFFKFSNTYPMASKGLDGEIVTLHSFKDLYKMMDPAYVEKVKTDLKSKKYFGEFLETHADYYNSLQKGFSGTKLEGLVYYPRQFVE